MQLYALLGMNMSEKWSTGGITTLIGLGMTFVMLALIIGSIHLLRLILKGLDKSLPVVKEKLKSSLSRKDKKVSNVSSDENSFKEFDNTIDEETMSVIEQSVRRYVADSADDGKPHTSIKIVSVKEVTND